MKLNRVADEYYLSHDYKNLRQETKAHYKYCLGNALGYICRWCSHWRGGCTKLSTKQAKLSL